MPPRFASLALAMLAAGCGASGPPEPATPPAAPASSAPAPPLAPWDARFSVAEGFEKVPAAGPPVVIRNATLLLATGKTIARGSLLLQRGKIAAVVDGEMAP